jgi:hypothetical protein
MARRLPELEAQLKDAEARATTKRIQRDIDRAARQRKRGETREVLDEEFAKLKQQFTQARMATKGVQPSGLAALDPEGVLTKLIGQMARNRVKAGTVKAEALVDEVYAAVSEHLEGVTRRDIRDAISGYSIAPKTTRSDLRKQLDAVRAELQLLSKAEDIETGIRSPRREGPKRSEVMRLPAEGPRKGEARSSGIPLQGPKR